MDEKNKERGVRLRFVLGCLLCGVTVGGIPSALTMGQGVLPGAFRALDSGVMDDPQDTKEDEAAEAAGPSSSLLGDVLGEIGTSAAYKKMLTVVKVELRAGRPTAALRLLERDGLARSMKHAEFDRIRAFIARSYLTEGKEDKAVLLAEKAIARSGKLVPLAGWVAGQVAWRRGNFGRAQDMFALVGRSPVASEWFRSSGAFWAARSALRSGQTETAEEWLKKAAEGSRTFYGLIAQQALGHDLTFNWAPPTMGTGDKALLERDETIQAALALSEKGQVSTAIDKIETSPWMDERRKRESLLAYVMDRRSPALSLHLARKTKTAEGRFFDSALYPLSPWKPEAGFQVDEALVLALVRQESRFNPRALSGAGATGLMQILPSTAQYIEASSPDLPLQDPETNLAVGQKYVKKLLKNPAVGNDLLRMAMAYNAGPGNLAKWTTELRHIKDPLLFLESIPSAETRAFVERVMVNYWVYRIRMGQDVPSLESLAMQDDTTLASALRPASADLGISLASSR